ncbi:MAG: hypothetical protein JWP58_4018 [Hymenobacter sp.]|nr:hypothetical protein [Hymenobacter sp.]
MNTQPNTGRMPGNTAQPAMNPNANGTINETEFRQSVIPRAALSLAACQIAITKCANANAKEFAGFELTEATAVVQVLKEMGTPEPMMDANAQATLDKFRTMPAGPAFDKFFMQAEYDNHEFLRDLTDNYLRAPLSKPSPAETETHHIATVALANFKEHVAMTKRILKELA